MPTLITAESCRLCKHCNYLKNVPPGEPEGECKAMPPQIVALVVPGPTGQPSITVQTLFPRVNLDWVCGAWKPRIALATN